MKFLKDFFLQINPRTIYLYSFFTGIFTGLLAVLFYKLLHFFTHFNFEVLANTPLIKAGGELPSYIMIDGDPQRIFYFILPIIGGLLVGLITHYWAPEAAGTGTELFLDTFHNKSGAMRRRAPWAKLLASLCTLSTGGSAGKEGPTAQIGAGIGALFGRLTKMGARAQRTLLLAGAAGGLGAIFRAPLGGALTAVEVLYKEDFESDALVPCVISSVTAYTVFSSFIGFHHIFNFGVQAFHSPIELVFYIPLGLLCSGIGYLFVKIFHTMKDHFFEKLPLKKPLIPAFGGLLVGCVGFFHPEAIGEGFGFIQLALDGNLESHWIAACRIFALMALLKIFTTSFTIQSGGSGGIFGPSLFIGGMLGGFVGTLSHHFYPQFVPEIGPFIIVGMASFFAGVANASIAALVIVCELTGGYELLPPLMVVTVTSLIFSRNWSIYMNQVKNKFFSRAHLWDMNPGTLKEMSVQATFEKGFHTKALVKDSDTLKSIENLSNQLHETDFIVESDLGELLGIISFRDFYYDYKEMHDLEECTVAKDLISRKIFYIGPHDTLYNALQKLIDTDFDKIPVAELIGDKLMLQGYIQYQDILRFYQATEGHKNFLNVPKKG
jgi:chloride channel protein, CIC family